MLALLVVMLSVGAAGDVRDADERGIQAPEVVAEIRVQGNVVTPDAEILQIAGVQPGATVDADTLRGIETRLRASKRFERIEIRKRFASIADSSQIVIVIIVDEGPVDIERTGDPDKPVRAVRRRRPNLLFLPVFSVEDGYGLTYGVRFTLPDPAGPSSGLSFPLTWGGDKRAAAEFRKDFEHAPVSRLEVGASISRRENPHYEEQDDRRGVWAGVARDLAPALRAGATAGWQNVSFGSTGDHVARGGLDLTFDTRLDPVLARNAVFARAAWERDSFTTAGVVHRSELEAIGYLGLMGQTVLVARAQRDDANHPLPPYMKSLLGGMANVRGLAAGTAAGDTLVAGTIELRIPLNSPLSVGKVGISVFADVGAAYDKGSRLSDQPLEQGFGVAIWFSAAFVRVNLAVAHGVGSSTRTHFGVGASVR